MLDFSTYYLVATVVVLVLATLLAVAAAVHSSLKELQFWAAAQWLMALGFLGGHLPGAVLGLVAALLMLRGLQVVLHTAWRWQEFAALMLVLVCATPIAISMEEPSFVLYVALQLCSALVFLRGTVHVLRNSHALRDHSFWLLALVFTTVGLAHLMQVCDMRTYISTQLQAPEWQWGDLLPMLQLPLSFSMLLVSLSQQVTRLRNQVSMDILTGIPNRRGLQRFSDRVMPRAELEKMSVAVLMVNVDNFREVNNTYGHMVGDEVLEAVSGRLRTTLRPGDCLCRFGGDEFVAVLPGLDPRQALDVAQRLCKDVAVQPFAMHDQEFKVTVSVGTANTLHHGYDLDALIVAADRAMTEAKRSGRNRALAASLK